MGLPRVDTRLSHRNLIAHIRHHQVNQYYPSKLLLSKRRLQSTTVVTAHQSVPEIFTYGPLQLLINSRLHMVVDHLLQQVRALYHGR